MEQDINAILSCFISIFLCFMLSVTYLASIHVWNSPYSRDHPETIKKRFISAFVMLFIAPCFLYVGLNKEILEKASFFHILGLRTQGLCQAIFMPLFLTMILFLGPISMELYSGLSKLYTEEMYWFSNMTNLIWIRNHIAAPLSEEFTYRSCMLPLLVQCFKPSTAVIINPLFFGVAHFHHMRERINHMGMDFNTALKISCFQFVYTTIFGMYSAYLFYRTGHFISLFIVHAFCNHMGFPEIMEIRNYKKNKKVVVSSLFLIGFLSWCILLNPLTEPSWYHNKPI
ncbi:CAAX prenyl protease 2 isoform X1 [Anoplophora glabripennis]|uniref:CAAX prenyl protease 2 isoform X1 n=1 Tax=Anoplophora glabripennis TaxID=217634 RepID=UPI000874C03F|nr:CAAX prenyl protease 2 isoform X1 [Anoplophora glabripennis]